MHGQLIRLVKNVKHIKMLTVTELVNIPDVTFVQPVLPQNKHDTTNQNLEDH